MRWYTNVQLIGNHFLVRAYEDGKHIEFREEFKPTLFVKSKKESKYRTLSGEIVDAVQPGTVRDCREFLKKYENVDGFEIYGNERYIYQYISEKYSEEEIKFDINKIKLVTIDIEVASENGFPDVESCSEEILAITLQIKIETVPQILLAKKKSVPLGSINAPIKAKSPQKPLQIITAE